MPCLRSAIIACLLSGLIACASIPATRAAKSDFGGEWSVKWCDKTDPQADCGGFYLSLVQEGESLCGSYSGARVRLSQLDDGGSRAIHGIVVGDSAVLTIESGRSGAVYLVSASVRGDRMRWKLRDTVREADQDIDIIARDDELQRHPPGHELSERHAETVAACRAANENG